MATWMWAPSFGARLGHWAAIEKAVPRAVTCTQSPSPSAYGQTLRTCALPMLDPRLRRLPTTSAVVRRLQDPRVPHYAVWKLMADDAKNAEAKHRPAEEEPKKKGETAAEKEKLPPPPEKPLPGDCCGSGCVRCVWDVYYEELEEYNKLRERIAKQS